jgi:hypothetical protein
VKRKIPGFAWFIEVNEQKQLRYDQITTGNLRFSRQILSFGRTYTLSDFQQQELGWRNKQLILDLKLSGSLSQDELSELHTLIKSLSNHYLHVDCENQVGVAVDTAFIQSTFAEGTSAYQWLTAISEEPDSDLALQLAFSIIQKYHSA